jgi:hypothetical protein
MMSLQPFQSLKRQQQEVLLVCSVSLAGLQAGSRLKVEVPPTPLL